MKYRSGVVLGETYRDKRTGLVGTAIVVSFFEHACERVILRYLHDGELKEASFDAPEVEHVVSGATPPQRKPGGPVRPTGRRP